jgi:hypothetical protein
VAGFLILIDLKKKKKTNLIYAWGLETSSDNQVEAYVLLQGFCMVLNSSIQSLTVVEDSSTIVKSMTMKSPLVVYNLASILVRAQLEASDFQRISFCQVLRERNQHAY